MSELMLCPFCGKEPILDKSRTFKGEEIYQVYCPDTTVHISTAWCSTRKEAVDTWNKRIAGRPLREPVSLPEMRPYRKALRDVVNWFENHSIVMSGYKLTTGKDYMAFLRMFRDNPDNLMEYGEMAEYSVPDACMEKVNKVKAKNREMQKEKVAEGK